ncbi:MAG: tRNA (adenosine(37)-N6)-dimethylallyltransferase MiaA [Clostridia bacterium]|nr:tRNA (adenosine(37)-N6)-dimethylallyltransferase MiaA [Clostridia bacterium]
MIPLLVIGGPTASGKTAVGIRLAKLLDGEIVSADSMQVYRHMDIGTAKPDLAERDGIVHHLLDIVEPTENFSLAQYVPLAHQTIEEIHTRGKLPILVGGTGLYIDTVVQNIKLSEQEKEAGAVREKLMRQVEEKGSAWLHEYLEKIDPQSAAKIHENNVKRLVRAVEVYELTGVTMSEHNHRSRLEPPRYRTYYMALQHERETLYDRIDRRVDVMMQQGLLAEVQQCVTLGAGRQHTSMQAIGYRQMLDYLEGNSSLEEAVDKIKQESRRYAKRQLTWFRRSAQHWTKPEELREEEIIKWAKGEG